ncbi:hypothetical protein SDC9_92660 [bioreactor metagenome]|uniref:Uncharacterized protein n=1 Tax=bioreactor metagenome TaxID=1076179 RepID=A0A644ZZ10_9ZZZZ
MERIKGELLGGMSMNKKITKFMKKIFDKNI